MQTFRPTPLRVTMQGGLFVMSLVLAGVSSPVHATTPCGCCFTVDESFLPLSCDDVQCLITDGWNQSTYYCPAASGFADCRMEVVIWTDCAAQQSPPCGSSREFFVDCESVHEVWVEQECQARCDVTLPSGWSFAGNCIFNSSQDCFVNYGEWYWAGCALAEHDECCRCPENGGVGSFGS